MTGSVSAPPDTAASDVGATQTHLSRVAERLFVEARRLHRLASLSDWSRSNHAIGQPLGDADFAEIAAGVDQRVLGLTAALDTLNEALAERLGRDAADDLDDQVVDGPSHDAAIWAQEQERYRLAREIHDGPAQILANAIMESEYFQRAMAAEPERVRDEMPQMTRRLREGLTEIRSFLFNLRPPALQDLGLRPSLQRFAEEYQNRFQIQARLEIADLDEHLTKAQEVTIFRITQEALQNVQRHANAKEVTIRCHLDRRIVRLEISDDGRGFEPKRLDGRRFGIVGMRERAQMAGGKLTLASRPGCGTRITVTLPLARPTTEAC